MKNISRRSFLKTGAVAAAGLTIVPGSVLGKSFGYTAPSDKLNIAGIGVGGMGRRNLANMNTENIVALCDVDWHYADKTFKDYPKAKRFKDWRVMFDEMGKSIDAIMVATPDHTHAGVTAHAITLGKHCYTQKPLTHSVYESRLLTKLAKKYKVATQMGNQGNSFDWCRQIAEWIQSGVIGDVYEVHCWTDRPIWPQGLMKPNDTPKCPKTLDWDLWIGPAQKRPYNPVYTPWNWRGWWDFGTGALGDMACHIMDPLYWALDLKYPTSVIGCSTLSNLYSSRTDRNVYIPRTSAQRKCQDAGSKSLLVRWWLDASPSGRIERRADDGRRERRYHLHRNERKDHDRLLRNEPDLITGFRHGTFQPAQTDDPESERWQWRHMVYQRP